MSVEGPSNLLSYLKLTRPDHWFKNIFILPGFFIAYVFTSHHQNNLLPIFIVGTIAVCFICSANYIINEWLDREFDKFHPVKKNRPSVVENLNPLVIALEYVFFALLGLGLSLLISIPFTLTNLTLLIMGLIYNLKPFRTKDIPYLDVLSESINNPIRFMLGWFMVTSAVLPPATLLIAYWIVGAFLMTTKRFSELNFIKDPALAVQYRKSFRYYTPEKLLMIALFYAVCCAFFGTAFFVEYKPILSLTLPFYAILLAWYLAIGLKLDSAAQHPEKMYKEKYFLLFSLCIIISTLILLNTKNPMLNQTIAHFSMITKISNSTIPLRS